MALDLARINLMMTRHVHAAQKPTLHLAQNLLVRHIFW